MLFIAFPEVKTRQEMHEGTGVRTMKRFFSVQAWAASILMFIGMMTMTGWIVRNSAMVQIGPDFVGMVFITAACFTLIGIALFLPIFGLPSATKIQVAIGWILIAIALTVLVEYITGTALFINLPALHSWINDGNPVPGRMAPGAALGFILTGTVLVMMPRVRSKAAGGAIQVATFILLLLGFFGLAGYALRLDLLYPWIPAKRIAVQSAVGLIVAGVGLWSQWRNAEWYLTQRYFRDDEKTGYVAATILTVIALTAGIAGFSVQQAALEKTLAENLLVQLNNQTSLFQAVVQQSAANAANITTRPRLIQLTRLMNRRQSDSESARQLLNDIGNSLLASGYSGIAIYDASGREIMHHGHFARKPEITADLGLAAPASLLWDKAILMRSRLPLRDGMVVVGSIMIEQALPLITEQLARAEGFGQTGELGMCVLQSDLLTCFPQHLNPKVHTFARVNANGKLTPMGHAVNGRAGIFEGLDYRGHNVIAAYGPLATGMGMVIKQDTAELYQPIRKQLNWYMPMLLLLAAGGALLLRSQVKPLVWKLLQSEREAMAKELHIRTVVDNVAEGIVTLNGDGIIESFNSAASRLFGYSMQEAIGMNIKAMMPPEMRNPHEDGMQRYLREGHARYVGTGTRELSAMHKNGTVFPLEVSITEMLINERRLFVGILRDVTERKHAEKALLESEARLREITETLGEGVLVIDRNNTIIFSNPAAQQLLGWTEEELLGQNGHTLFHHTRADGTPYPAEHCALVEGIRSGQRVRTPDDVFWRKDGSMLPVSVNSTPIVRDGAVTGAVMAFHDIIDRKRSEQKLAAESAKNAMLLRTASDGIHVLDLQGNLLNANDAFCRMLGYSPEEIQGMNVAQWDAQWSAEELMEQIRQIQDKSTLFETKHRRRDGSVFDVEIHAASVKIDGKPMLFASARDITERKKAAEQVQHLAHFDILTDLPNRALLSDRLQQAIAKAKRDKDRMALMFIDLDKFKPVNDHFGHDVGDLLLKEVAKRLRHCLRESDTVARVGGDEFIVLLPQIEVEQYALLVAEKILATLNEKFNIAGRSIYISGSIGVAVYPDDGNLQEDLMKSADSAMYHAKEHGGGSIISFRQLKQADSLTSLSN